MRLTEYLDMVSGYWDNDARACADCNLFDDPHHCQMLHDRSVPDANCLGVLNRDGVKQPDCTEQFSGKTNRKE